MKIHQFRPYLSMNSHFYEILYLALNQSYRLNPSDLNQTYVRKPR
jgi:hypothetical protein